MSENFTPRQQQCMDIYDALVNEVSNSSEPSIEKLICELVECDDTGQFVASGARFLAAVDAVKFNENIHNLIDCAISKDRERKYISSLLEAIWGHDYMQRVDQLRENDDSFRRIYKRIYPADYTAK